MKIMLRIILLVCSCVIATVTVVGQTCPSCSPSTPASDKDYVVDLASREQTGPTKHQKGDRIRIIVLNKNPFRYEYRKTIDVTPVAEPALTSFLGLLGPFVKSQIPDQAKTTTEVNKSGFAAFPPQCGDAHAAFEALSATRDDLRTQRDALNKQFDEQIEPQFKQVQRQYNDALNVLHRDNAKCELLCSTASGLLAVLQGYSPDLSKYEASIAVFRADALGQLARIQRFRQAGYPPECIPAQELSDMADLARFYSTTVADAFADNLKKVKDAKKTFDEMVATITKVFSTPGAFYQVHTVGDYDLPTNVNFKVETRDLTIKDNKDFVKIAEAKLNFGGGPRFALSGGIVFSPLEKPEFDRIQGFARDRIGNIIGTEITNIVGLKENSRTRIAPLVILHGIMKKYKDVGVHASLGLTGSVDSLGGNVEFLVGPSLSFLEDRMFFTAGGYAGRQQRLEGNLFLGAPVPTTLTTIPVRKDYAWNWGFAISYKIK